MAAISDSKLLPENGERKKKKETLANELCTRLKMRNYLFEEVSNLAVTSLIGGEAIKWE